MLAGVVAPSRRLLLSRVLLSLPVVPVVVLNKTTPLVAEVLTPCTLQYLIVLLTASLMKRIATPVVLVLAIVKAPAGGALGAFPDPVLARVPPGRPSKI